MRHNPTYTEARAWSIIRRFNQYGQKFLFFRQYVLGGYILDFYCPWQMLAVEIDGDSHNDKKHYDAQRDLNLQRGGIRTIRFSSDYVLENPSGLFESIRKQLNYGWEIPED